MGGRFVFCLYCEGLPNVLESPRVGLGDAQVLIEVLIDGGTVNGFLKPQQILLKVGDNHRTLIITFVNPCVWL